MTFKLRAVEYKCKDQSLLLWYWRRSEGVNLTMKYSLNIINLHPLLVHGLHFIQYNPLRDDNQDKTILSTYPQHPPEHIHLLQTIFALQYVVAIGISASVALVKCEANKTF